MKLPENIHAIEALRTYPKALEEVVRDCAKAVAEHLDNCTHPVCISDRKRTGYGECAGGYLARNAVDAILSRYGLEPKPAAHYDANKAIRDCIRASEKVTK